MTKATPNKLVMMLVVVALIISIASNTEVYDSTNISRTEVETTDSLLVIKKPISLSEYTPHAPILITSDSNFTNLGFSGDGSEGEPYNISGLSISTDGDCINIQNTRAHFIIEHCFLNSSSSGRNSNGIFMNNVTSGTVNGCVIDSKYYAVYIQDSVNCTVVDSILYRFFGGIYAKAHSENFTAINNTLQNLASDINWMSLYINESKNATIVNNTIDSHNCVGIWLYLADGSMIDNNTLTADSESRIGIYIGQTQGCQFLNNTFEDCGVRIASFSDSTDWVHTFSNNTSNGKPIGYYSDLTDTVVDISSYGQYLLFNSDNVTITNGDFNSTAVGVAIGYSTDCIIEGNVVAHSSYGIDLTQSDNIKIIENEISGADFGINVGQHSDNCNVSRNTISNSVSLGTGIYVNYYSTYSNVLNNTIQNCDSGINLFQSSTYGEVENNTISACSISIYLLYSSSYCNITSNEIYDSNEFGIFVIDSPSVRIEDNLISRTLYRDGIHLDGSGSSNINGNIICDVGHNGFTDRSGIYLTDSAGGNISQNTIYHSTEAGIFLFNADNWNISNNTIFLNQFGIYANQDSSGNNIFYNLIGWQSLYNGNDNGTTNVWDDNSANGNGWNDYIGSGTYPIDGSTGSVDRYPWLLTDSVQPSINTPAGFQIEVGTTGHSINWTASDKYPSNYHLERNGIPIETELWCGGNISISVDGLLPAVYTFNMTVFDAEGNSAESIVVLTVIDTVSPTIDDQPNTGYEGGSTGNSITWDPEDLCPDSYVVYSNDSPFYWGDWNTSSEVITVSIDGFDLGVHNFTIVVNDTSGNDVSDQVLVTVYDTTLPTIDEPSDDNYERGTTGLNITWTPSDLYPDSYQVERNTSSYESGPWSGSAIIVDLIGLDVGLHNFTIIVYDEGGNNVKDTVFVNVAPSTPPSVSGPGTITYEAGSSGNSITWTASDSYPDSYQIWLDDIVNETGIWDGSNIVFDIDGLDPGSHNITIVLEDKAGNISTDYVEVTVDDTIDPNIVAPSDYDYDYGDTGNWVNWTTTDLYLASYSVLLNGSPHIGTTVISGTQYNITIDADGLEPGAHNFTLIVLDGSGNEAISSVIIRVIEYDDPTIDSPEDMLFEEGSTGHTLLWKPYDASPKSYEILQNGTPVKFGDWAGEWLFDILDSLSAGDYNYTCVVYDVYGNSASDQVKVTVLASNPPTIDSPDDVEYNIGETGSSITWIVSDAYPSYYRLYRDGVIISQPSWDGSSVTESVEGLSIGTYNYTLIVVDLSDNSARDTVFVHVLDPIPPSVENVADFFLEAGTSSSISWDVSDDYLDYFEIFLNGMLIASNYNPPTSTTASIDLIVTVIVVSWFSTGSDGLVEISVTSKL